MDGAAGHGADCAALGFVAVGAQRPRRPDSGGDGGIRGHRPVAHGHGAQKTHRLSPALFRERSLNQIPLDRR